jgi:TonB-linked SusC/RagA family outer membrane protein
MLLLCFAPLARLMAQQRTVSGKVTSAEDRSFLPGVNVLVKGTTSGTTTGSDGSYSLNVSDNATIVFSFIGYMSQEVAVGNQAVVDVQLVADVKQLTEVVVTALGIQREEKALGYSVSKVDNAALTSVNQTNVINSLSGRVAGVQITGASGNMGGSSRITLRGINSIAGNNSPLFVVDGIPFDNSDYNSADTQRGSGGYDYGNMAQYVNPDDIESVSILKGPNAAALYGSRASNGVIVITTKKGTKRQGIGVRVNSGVGFENIFILPKYQNEYGGGFAVSDADGGVNGFAQQNINGQTYSIADYGTDESWGPRYAGQQVLHWNAFDEWDAQNYLKPREWKAPDNDVRDFFNTGVSWNNNVELSGGSDNSTFRLSYTNYDLKGYIPNSMLKRNTVAVNGTTKLGDKVNAFGSITYVNNAALGRPATGYGDNNVMQKFNQWGQRQLDMEELKSYKNPDGSQRTWNRTAWNDPTPNYSDNPYWTRYENYQNDETNRYFGNIGFSIDILDWLKFETKLMSDYYTIREQERVAFGSQAQSSYAEANREFNENNYQFLFLANKPLAQNLSLQATFGGNRMHQRYNRNNGITKGGLLIPDLYTLNNSAAPAATGDYSRTKRINSLFGSANLGYKNMVFVDLTLRNDWSSTLPAANNSYLYPSVSSSFVFSDLGGLNESNWLSFGKLKASWAQVGNDTDPYNIRQAYVPALDEDLYPYNFGSDALYSVSNTLTNPNLKPESTQSYEVGTELKFFSNRIGLNVTYYDKATSNQILPAEVSGSTGYRYKLINAGKVTNKGWEVELSLTPLKLENGFQWDVFVNWARNRNKIVELAQGIENYTLANAPFAVSLNALEGKPYGSIMGTDFIYDANGNKVTGAPGTSLEGRYLPSEVKEIGNLMPDWTGGISNTFRYKGIELSGLIDIRQGGQFFSTTYMWGTYSGILEHTIANNIREEGILLDGVTAIVDEEEKPLYNADGSIQTGGRNEARIDAITWGNDHYAGPAIQNVFDASYIKLREVRIGYTLPARLTGPVRNARVSAFGRNLAIWGTKVTDFVDPENTTSGGNVQGLEGGALPSLRTYGVNISFEF